MAIFLYGPPGSGKSTLISLAASFGYPSVDVESAGRESLAGKYDFAGMADVDVSWAREQPWAVDGHHVLILPTYAAYVERMEERDRAVPRKAGQDGPTVWRGFADNASAFDCVLNTAGMTAGDSLFSLFSLLGPEAKNGFSSRRKSRALAQWMVEEARELSVSETDASRLDALFDCLGIILLGMTSFPGDDVRAALAAYRTAQLKRGRSVAVPHHELIARMVSTMSTFRVAPGYPDVVVEYAIRRAEAGGFRTFDSDDRKEGVK